MKEVVRSGPQGFALIEVLAAIAVLTFGLLAAGQLMVVSVGAGSLARSKGTAAIAAQNKLEYLSDLYHRTPGAMDLAPGAHGPEQMQVLNPVNEKALNHFSVEWIIAKVPDPRPGKMPDALLASVTVVPVHSGGGNNEKPLLNKSVNVTTVFSPRTP
jgi:prepilin-type N-terminal cleavage/methylation domain-containing protein